MKTLTQLRIDNFRGIRDLNIEHLTSINVIVGDNNCGKTSVIEAIQFLRSGSPANIYNIARLRDRTLTFFSNSLYDSFICMFPKEDNKLQIKLSGEYDSQSVSYVLSGTESKELIDLNELDRIARREFAEANGETETDVFDGSSVYMIGEQTLTESIRLNRLTRVTGTSIRLKPQIKISYVSPFEHLNGNIVNRIIKNDAYKLICLNALQLFDPEIEDIMIFKSDVSNRPVEYLKHKRLGNMPLSTYGDGIKKVLVLANAIIGATDGILLIDEFY